MKFSERHGYKQPQQMLKHDELSNELRNSIWSAFVETVIRARFVIVNKQQAPVSLFIKETWLHFLKRPVDTIPGVGGISLYDSFEIIRIWYFDANWYEVYDFIEFVIPYKPNFGTEVNFYLKRELAPYTIIDNKLVLVEDEDESNEISEALTPTDKFEAVQQHLKTAIQLYSDRKNPDFRNSIKESISAVESMVRILLGNGKATLGQALNELERKHQLPGSLKAGFSALYGFTSDSSGIRHSLKDGDFTVDIEEARFMLVTCSAFINYLKRKIY